MAGDDQDGTVGSILPQPLQVRVLDADGVPQPDVTVTWSIQRGEGSFTTGTTSQTNASGIASATWRLGPVVIFDAVATPGSPNSTNTTVAASPTFFTAGSSTTITATVRDQFNNLVGGVNVNLSSNASGTFGDPTLQTATSGADLGKASTSYTSSVAGNHTITAQIGSFNKTVVVAVQAATAGSKMVANTSITGTATFGGSVTPLPEVLVTDQFDNPVANVPVSWSLIQGKGSVSFETQTNSSGVSAVTAWTLDALGPGYDPAFAVVNQVRASAAVSTGSPVTFTRTVQVSFANLQTLFGTVEAGTTQGTCLGSGCHVGPLALDLRPGNAYPDLIAGGAGFTYVTPSDSTTVSSSVNRLLFRLKGLGSQPMPTTSRGGTLPANIITIIAAWVRQGAPSP